MSNIRKAILVIALGVVMTGCASTQTKPQQYSSTQSTPTENASTQTKQEKAEELSANIIYAPDIDVSYAEVLIDIDKNIGTDVRWGGKVLKSTQIDESTIRLTVFSHPLATDGRPIKTQKADDENGRFIVDLKDGLAKGVDFQGRFVTFYGGVTSRLVVTNGDREKALPVIDAQELVNWNTLERSRNYANNRRGNAYYSLGYKGGFYGFGLGYHSPFYGKSHFGFRNRHSSFGYSKFSSFGHRGFRGRGFRSRGFRRH